MRRKIITAEQRDELVKLGFLDKSYTSLYLHDALEHCPFKDHIWGKWLHVFTSKLAVKKNDLGMCTYQCTLHEKKGVWHSAYYIPNWMLSINYRAVLKLAKRSAVECEEK